MEIPRVTLQRCAMDVQRAVDLMGQQNAETLDYDLYRTLKAELDHVVSVLNEAAQETGKES